MPLPQYLSGSNAESNIIINFAQVTLNCPFTANNMKKACQSCLLHSKISFPVLLWEVSISSFVSYKNIA